jgi:hypothetical protein
MEPELFEKNQIKLSLNKKVVLKPKESIHINLGITFILNPDQVGIITGGKIIFNSYSIRLTSQILWGNLPTVIKVTNLTEHEIGVTPQKIIPMYIINIKSRQDLRIELNKILNKTNRDNDPAMYITDKTAEKFLTAQLVEIGSLVQHIHQTPKNTNILKHAEEATFSATAYMIRAEDQNNIIYDIVAYENRAYSDTVNKKTYFPIYIKNMRVIACADSGSDLTLIQLSLFRKLFPDYNRKLTKGSNITIKSYSNNKIEVHGQCKVAVKFSKSQGTIDLILTVIQDITEAVPQFLFGNDSLRKTLAMIAYTGDIDNPEPEIVIQKPLPTVVPTYYTSPGALYTCKGTYSLGPYSSTEIELKLHPAAPVLRFEEILISSHDWSNVQLMESKSDLDFDEHNNCYTAKGFLVNLSAKPVSGTIEGRFEIIDNYTSYLICSENKGKLKKVMMKNPPARVILPSAETEPMEHNCNCNFVFNLQLQPNEPIPELTESELQETAGIGKVTYTGTAEVSPNVIDGGLDLPTMIHKSPAEALNLASFDPDIRPFIKKIFLDKYPEVIALHSLDSGDISKTLGYTTLRLVPGEQLPRHRRIYQLSPQDSRYLEELLEQFIRFNFVRRAPVDSTNIHLYGMSTYLVPRKKPTDLARLVIDFSPLTSIIQSPPSIVPDISASLQQLQGKALFTVMDLKYAYLALRISEESKPLTTFLTQGGAYQWLTIPTGAACSPAYFIDAVNRILHNDPVLDEQGKPIYTEPNKVKLKHDILPNCFHYFDDIICSSEPRSTYQETLEYHFSCLDRIIYRLHFHGVKLSVNKSEFAKSKVLFLGWIVSHDYVIPDPRRLEKIRNAKFPESKKEIRSFLGLVNSIRRVVPFEVTKEMQVLTPLTSSTTPFHPTEKHHQAFDKIKKLLLQEPLFCNLIRENATKILWVDAASSSGCLGAVLAQQIKGSDNTRLIPESIDLEDKVHQILYDKKLPYEPAKLYTQFPIENRKITLTKTTPPKCGEKDPLKGFTSENWNDSLFWSVISLMVLYNCKVPSSTIELRKLAVTELKKGILAIKLKDLSFNNVHHMYKNFLSEFEEGLHQVDQNLLLVQALAQALHRCFIIVSTLKQHQDRRVFKFNQESIKPPLILGLYEIEGKLIFTPFFYNKNLEFNIDNLKDKVQIIAYLSKSVPESYKSKSILDLEALAILTALHSLQRYISNTRCYLLTDSRVLYYLFNQKVGDSSTKIRRWVLKLLSDYPLVSLHFIRTTSNLADYLTRQGLPRGDLEKLNLKEVEIVDFYDKLPKHDFTLTEWVKFCADHPEYLTTNVPSVHLIRQTLDESIEEVTESQQLDYECNNNICYTNTGLQNILDIKRPIEVLKERLSRANIIKAQKLELSTIYNKCLASQDFTHLDKDTDMTYILILDLMMVMNDKGHQICVPPSLIGPLLSYTHLLGHLGMRKMLENLTAYYFETKYKIVRRFISSCYACFLNHGSSKKNKLGNYPIAEYPFEEVSVDLAESLNTVNGLSHLLIVQCVLSNFILIYPLKTKSAQEVCKVFLYNVLQSFNVTKVHQDNGPCFRNTQWLKLMATLNIQVINSSANNPSSRGKAEKAVGQVKILMKKLLTHASSDTLNWDMLPFLVSKLMNHTISVQTGFKPVEMIFGKDKMAQAFFDREKLLPVHHSVANNKESLEKLTEEIKTMSKMAQETLLKIRTETHEKVNKTRTDKQFKQNDIVFVLDRYNLPGNTRPLKSKFYPSPYVVLKPYFTTCLVRRLADNFTALYSMDDLKLYKGTDPIFSTLPVEVSKVLLHDFKDLIDSDYLTILQHDPLDIPTGIPFIDTVSPSTPDDQDIFNPIKGESVDEQEINSNNEVPSDDFQEQTNQIIEEEIEEDAPEITGPITRSRAKNQIKEQDKIPEILPKPNLTPANLEIIEEEEEGQLGD